MFAKSIVTKGGDVFRDEYSLAFDGTNDYVSTGFVPNYTNITISVWVKVLADSDTKPICAARDSADDGFLFYMGTTETPRVKLNGTSVTASAVTPNVWTHIAFTWDGSTIKLYQDGILANSASESSVMNISKAMEIGGESSNSYHYYGNISEVAVYNLTLTANQIKTLYNGREPYNHKEGVASGNLQAWYRMGDGSLDDFNLINDETNTTLGNTMITGDFDTQFTEHNTDSNNTVTYPTTTSVTIVSDGSQAVGIQDANLLTSGKAYKCIIDVTINSGSGIRMQDSSTVFQTMTSTGVYTFYFIPSSTQFYIYRRTASASNTTINSMVLQEFGGNAGTMINMDATDIKGDTP